MNRTLLSLASLAVIALSAQAFAAADKPGGNSTRPGAADTPGMAKVPTQTTPTPKTNTPPPPPPPPAPMVVTLTSATFGMAEYKVGEQAMVTFNGLNLSAASPSTADCLAKVSWGDGASPEIYVGQNGKWLTLNHVYGTPGVKTFTVTPKSFTGAACVGGPIAKSLVINPPAPLPPSAITKLVVTPLPNPKARLISTKWVGTAPNSSCSYILNFGDGTSKKTGAGPVQPGSDEQHVYAAGTYSVIVTPSNADYDSCTLGPDAGPKTFTVE